MAINYASKFSKKVDQRFFLKSRTGMIKGGKGYDWTGVSTVTVYDRPIVAMNDYTLTGADRYGTPVELQNTKQDLTVTKDRSFSVTIDKKSEQDTVGVMEASAFLKDQMDEVITPEIDAYRLSVLGTRAGTTSAVTVIDATNAYEATLDAGAVLDEGKVPEEGRVMFCSPTFYKFLKLDNSFILASELGQKTLMKGQVGEVDGVAVIKVPATYLPASTNFIMCHKQSMITVMKLDEYKVHDDAPGISGSLIEGRVRYDAFVLDNKQVSVYRSRNA